MDPDEVWRHTHEQRRALARLLSGLTEDEWSARSLCERWTVQDVAAHVIRSATVTPREVVVGLVRARGRYNSLVAEDAHRAAQRPASDIVADFERHDGSRRRPLGTSVVDPLLDVLVHTQDIAIPLGRSHPMPVEAAVVAARRAHAIRWMFAGSTIRRGLAVRAIDADFATGRGPLVEGPVSAVLLLLTGRTAAAMPLLSGPGLERLTPGTAFPT